MSATQSVIAKTGEGLDYLCGLFTEWLVARDTQSRRAAECVLKQYGILVMATPDPHLITTETHWGCKVLDCNGHEWLHLRWARTDTGEAEQCVLDEHGSKQLNPGMTAVATQLVKIPLPIRVVTPEEQA